MHFSLSFLKERSEERTREKERSEARIIIQEKKELKERILTEERIFNCSGRRTFNCSGRRTFFSPEVARPTGGLDRDLISGSSLSVSIVKDLHSE